MKTDTPQTIYLKDYTPPAFLVDTVDLDFVIPADYRDFGGERVEGRLQQLGKLTGKKLQFRWM